MKPILLAILDGVGLRDEKLGNAVSVANMPNYDYLLNNYPHSTLEASGEEVGLTSGTMGNSEVGHMNMGAGRIVFQPIQLINEKIKDRSFFDNENLLEVISHIKKNNSKLHVFGLMSDAGVHSVLGHLYALMELAKKEGIEKVYYHFATDGRDTPPKSALKFLEEFDAKREELNIGKIATISGRFYAMDRDNRWDRINKAYDAMVNGVGEIYESYKDCINSNYNKDVTDEFVTPTIINSDGLIEENDGIIVYNYRPDRLREIFTAISNKEFSEFETKKFDNIKIVTMMKVSDDVIAKNAFKLDTLSNTLGEYVSSLGIKQLRIAETEKYAHVTYFFDGGIEKELKGCKRILIPSPKVTTYDLAPDMSADEITENLLREMENFDLIILNFANGDMLGHTGIIPVAVQSLETVDKNLGKIITKIKELEGTLIVTADHGNCEEMIDENGEPKTSHTTNLVPFIIMKDELKLKDGKLGDIAPTILSLMNIDIPSEMTGEVLIS